MQSLLRYLCECKEEKGKRREREGGRMRGVGEREARRGRDEYLYNICHPLQRLFLLAVQT